MNKFTKIMILLGTVGLCLLIFLQCFYIYRLGTPIIERETILGILLSVLAIIVALGVAHSFISVYTAKDELGKLNALVEHIQKELSKKIDKVNKDLEDRTSMLEEKSNALFLLRQEHELEGKADNYYKSEKYIQAIKTELEFIELILNNRRLCGDDFIKHVGFKRSNIANDLLQCTKLLDKKERYCFDEGEFEDIARTISRLECAILKTDNVYYFPQAEFDRYVFLFKRIKYILGQIYKEYFPVAFNKAEIEKLVLYTKILDGNKSDEEQKL